jgi:hypothetical protein
MEHATPPPDRASAAQQPFTDQIGEDTQYCRRVLLNLIDIGNELAAMALAEAKAAAPPAEPTHGPTPTQTAIVAFNTVAQAVRRTVMLYDKLGKTTANRTAVRKRIIRDVEDVIQRKAHDLDDEKALHAEFLERLDRPDLEDEIANRSIAEIVTDICRDLGIAHLPGAHPWKRRLPHDIAILNARAAHLYGEAPSAELAALLDTAPPRPPKRITPLWGTDPPMDDPAAQVAHILNTVSRDRWESGG